MIDLKFERTGDRPLAFTGELIASVEEEYGGRKYRMELYSADNWNDGFVLFVEFTSPWAKDMPYSWALPCRSEDEVIGTIREIDWLLPVAGFPPGEKYEKRQAALTADLYLLVTRLAGQLVTQAEFVETL